MITWTEKEKEAIKFLAKQTDVSEEAVLRQALRLYQFCQILHYSNGHQMQWVDAQGNVVKDEFDGMCGCMGDD